MRLVHISNLRTVAEILPGYSHSVPVPDGERIVAIAPAYDPDGALTHYDVITAAVADPGGAS